MTLYRVLRTAKATLTRVFYLDEIATDATGFVSVTVARLDGTVVQGPLNTTGPTADHGYSFTFVGSDTLDELTLTWSATVGGDAIVLDQDVIQVVGGFVLTLGECRAADPVFTNTARYPTQDLLDRRNEVEDEFARLGRQSFVPRFARDVLSGNGSSVLKLKWPWLRRVLSIDGVTADAASFGADELGLLRHPSGWTYGTGNITVEYEHGMDRAPLDIKRAAKLRLKSFLLTTKSPLPDRAERIVTTEVGLVTLGTATVDSTGISEVDAALAKWPSPRPGFG